MSRAQLTSTVEQNTGGAVAPWVGGKNAAINGGADIWQRGTTFTNTVGYTADRWYQGAGNVTTTQETTLVPTGFRYSVKGTTTATSQPYWFQAIETAESQRFAGKTVTLSYYAATSDSSNVLLRLDYSTSVDNSAVGTYTSIGSSSVAATSSMPSTPQTATFVVPSTAKTLRIVIGAAGNQSTGATTTFSGVQLEVGSVATPFSRAGGTLQGELALCQRYYEKSYDLTVAPGTNTGEYNGNICSSFTLNTGIHSAYVQYKVSKRTTPTITLYDLAGSANYVSYANPGTSPTNGKNAGTSFISQNGFWAYVNNNDNIYAFEFQYTASAEL